jgi:hypothetical protein
MYCENSCREPDLRREEGSIAAEATGRARIMLVVSCEGMLTIVLGSATFRVRPSRCVTRKNEVVPFRVSLVAGAKRKRKSRGPNATLPISTSKSTSVFSGKFFSILDDVAIFTAF